MTSTSPAGSLSRSFASALRSPVSASSTIFAAIVVPIPGICVAVPSSARRATGAADSRIRAEARRYAERRNMSAPSSSSRSASRSNFAASSAFEGSASGLTRR